MEQIDKNITIKIMDNYSDTLSVYVINPLRARGANSRMRNGYHNSPDKYVTLYIIKKKSNIKPKHQLRSQAIGTLTF